MVVEEKLPSVEQEKPKTTVVGDSSTLSGDEATSNAKTEKILQSIREMQEKLDFSRIDQPQPFLGNPFSFPGVYEAFPAQFMAIEFTDPQAFVRWIEN